MLKASVRDGHISCCLPEQRSGIGIWPDPRPARLLRKDDRHPVMDVKDALVRLPGQDREPRKTVLDPVDRRHPAQLPCLRLHDMLDLPDAAFLADAEALVGADSLWFLAKD